jgi:quinol monooxygenase YgiN
MEINRRNLLAGSAAATAFPFLGGQLAAAEHAHADHEHSEFPKEAVILTAQLKAKAGEVEAVKQALGSLVGPTRKEEGCIHYILHQDVKDETKFMFYEVWADEEAFKQHGKTPHMKVLGPKLKGRTDKGGGVAFYKVVE